MREEILPSGDRAAIRRLAEKHGAGNVRVFGSTVRDERRAGSDLDVLVTMAPGRTLLDLIALEQDLEELLGVPVDVVSDAGISPHLRSQILAAAVPL
jgi:hypothetical protein